MARKDGTPRREVRHHHNKEGKQHMNIRLPSAAEMLRELTKSLARQTTASTEEQREGLPRLHARREAQATVRRIRAVMRAGPAAARGARLRTRGTNTWSRA